MAQIGMSDYKVQKNLTRALNTFGLKEIGRYSNSSTKEIEKYIAKATDILKTSEDLKSPFLSIELEKMCVNFEYSFFATNNQEQKRYDKQLSELQSAKASARLVFDPEAYRQHVLDAYGPHRKIMFPPAGEACVTVLQKQIQQLARPKTGIISPTIKEFYSARQVNLRVAREACIEAQCKALGLTVPKKSKRNAPWKNDRLDHSRPHFHHGQLLSGRTDRLSRVPSSGLADVAGRDNIRSYEP